MRRRLPACASLRCQASSSARRACAVKATGPQSTQVRVVSLESPTPNPIPVEGAPAACRVSSKDYTVGKRSPLAAAALRLTIAQRTRELAKVRVAAAMTPGLSPGGQSKQPAAALATAVDPSYSQPNQAKSLVGPTYIPAPWCACGVCRAGKGTGACSACCCCSGRTTVGPWPPAAASCRPRYRRQYLLPPNPTKLKAW